MLLTREQILTAEDLPKELVPCPEWGGDVYVRTLSGTERDDFENSLWEGTGKDRAYTGRHIRAKLCARTICDEQGQRLFSDADVEALGQKSSRALDRCADVARRLCGMTAEEVQALAKNSESDPTDASGSGSRES